jgi:hypothetical protein
MIPLTSSLYVSGTLDSTDKVLVDIGTGYYVEVCHVRLSLHPCSAAPVVKKVANRRGVSGGR